MPRPAIVRANATEPRRACGEPVGIGGRSGFNRRRRYLGMLAGADSSQQSARVTVICHGDGYTYTMRARVALNFSRFGLSKSTTMRPVLKPSCC